VKLSKRTIFKAAAILLTVAGLGVAPVHGEDDCCIRSSSDTGCCDDGIAGDQFCCDSGCDTCCDSGCLDRLSSRFNLGGLIKPSDRGFDDFISPMINFVYFEDPRTLTEVRPIFVSQSVPGTIGSGVAAGGSVQLYAMQFRIALSDRLSLIAVKDGYIQDNTNGTLDTILDSGWADVTAGLKYNLIRDACRGTLVSAGFTYEIPLGSRQTLQSIGDGEFNFFVTAGQRLFDGNAHLLSSVGYRLPVDNDVQVSAIHWSNHFDVRLSDRIYLFTEAAWWNWTGDASVGLPLGVQDLFSMPSTNVVGNNLVTQNVGLKFKPRRNVEAGIAYEFPLTGFRDIIQDRIQAELILRF